MTPVNKLIAFVTYLNFVYASSQVCTDLGNIRNIIHVHVTSDHFNVTSQGGPLSCAAECMRRRRCKSFNYNTGTMECALFHYSNTDSQFTAVTDSAFVFSNIETWPQRLIGTCANHDCPDNARCEHVSHNTRQCRTTGCSMPSTPNGNITFPHVKAETEFGRELIFTCSAGFTAEGAAICASNGTWTHFGCTLKPTSCAEVKMCDSSSVDGEYWIYLREFQNQRVRVYCHGLDTNQPQEFITLPTSNIGNYPAVSNSGCNSETPFTGIAAGTTIFHKIRIDVTTLAVDTWDKTFVSGSAGKFGRYGSASDCYTRVEGRTSSCGPKGTFTINLEETGFQLNSSQQWKGVDWKPGVKVTWVNQAVVNLQCGGYCGGCVPLGHLLLTVNTGEVLNLMSASKVSC